MIIFTKQCACNVCGLYDVNIMFLLFVVEVQYYMLSSMIHKFLFPLKAFNVMKVNFSKYLLLVISLKTECGGIANCVCNDTENDYEMDCSN